MVVRDSNKDRSISEPDSSDDQAAAALARAIADIPLSGECQRQAAAPGRPAAGAACPTLACFSQLTEEWLLPAERSELDIFAPRIAASRDDRSECREFLQRAVQIVDWTLAEVAPIALSAAGLSDLSKEVLRLGSSGSLGSIEPADRKTIAERITVIAITTQADPTQPGRRVLDLTSSAVRALGSVLSMQPINSSDVCLGRKESTALESVRRAYSIYAVQSSSSAAASAAQLLGANGRRAMVQMRIDLLDRICPEI